MPFQKLKILPNYYPEYNQNAYKFAIFIVIVRKFAIFIVIVRKFAIFIVIVCKSANVT